MFEPDDTCPFNWDMIDDMFSYLTYDSYDGFYLWDSLPNNHEDKWWDIRNEGDKYWYVLAKNEGVIFKHKGFLDADTKMMIWKRPGGVYYGTYDPDSLILR